MDTIRTQYRTARRIFRDNGRYALGRWINPTMSRVIRALHNANPDHLALRERWATGIPASEAIRLTSPLLGAPVGSLGPHV